MYKLLLLYRRDKTQKHIQNYIYVYNVYTNWMQV